MGLIAQLEIVFSADVLISPARFRCSVKTTQACRGPRGHGLRRPSAVRTAPFAKGGKPGWLLQCRLGCRESFWKSEGWHRGAWPGDREDGGAELSRGQM